MPKEILGVCIPIIGRVIKIWSEVFLKLRVPFGILVRKEKVFSESVHRIKIHLDVVVEVLEVHTSVTF